MNSDSSDRREAHQWADHSADATPMGGPLSRCLSDLIGLGTAYRLKKGGKLTNETEEGRKIAIFDILIIRKEKCYSTTVHRK